ncbi:MAG: type II secretion system protein M [Gammaproteobacteria bacterium]|nr:type II secretion system protein M [Gammaproteobacteria bacterium]
MKEWFNQLAPRERLLIMVAGGLLIITLIVTLGIRPIASNSANGQQQLEEKQQLLIELNRVAERFGPQQNGGTGNVSEASQSLVVIVDRTTRNNGLATYLKRNQPDGTSSIRLRLENVPFDALVEWLGQLESQYGLMTSAANIDTTSTKGRVNCNLTLDRGGR